MAKRTPRLAVALSAGAIRDLQGIWDYNADHRSEDAADQYEAFLLSNIERLSSDYGVGRRFASYPELRWVTARKKPKSDGHVVLYEINLVSESVEILHIFHTKMDIEGRLADELD